MLIFILSISTQLNAWSYHTHRKIAAEAFRAMPAEFTEKYESQRKAFLKGSTDPDILIKDFLNHVYHPDGSQTGGMHRIISLYDKAVSLMISGESDEKTAYVLGLLSHYIADLNQPLHTAGRTRDPDEDTYHARYERDVNRYLKHIKFDEVQTDSIDSLEIRVKKMAEEALKYYDLIGHAYREGNEISDLTEVTEKQIRESVRHVVAFWRSVCRDAGRVHADKSAPAFRQVWQINETPEKTTRNTININKATLNQLSDFFHISPAKAGRIVDGRPYRSVYDLARTKVFNPMYIKRNKDKIKVK